MSNSRASPDECVSLRDVQKTVTKKPVIRDISLGSIYSQIDQSMQFRNQIKHKKLRKIFSNQRIDQSITRSKMNRQTTHLEKVPRIKGFENLNLINDTTSNEAGMRLI